MDRVDQESHPCDLLAREEDFVLGEGFGDALVDDIIGPRLLFKLFYLLINVFHVFHDLTLAETTLLYRHRNLYFDSACAVHYLVHSKSFTSTQSKIWSRRLLLLLHSRLLKGLDVHEILLNIVLVLE